MWALTQASVSPDIVSAAVTKSYLKLDLARAAHHYNGAGLEGGIDYHNTMSVIRTVGKKDYNFRCALESILAAATWPAARVHSINPSFPSSCPRCGDPSDTALHTFWQCPCNANIGDTVQNTQSLVAAAVARSEETPCLWLRGILPLSLMKVERQYLPRSDLEIEYTGQCSWNSGTYYGDASGGEFSSINILRQCGCGLAAVSPDGGLKFGAGFFLPGDVQTGPRGELFALVDLIDEMAPLAEVSVCDR